MYRVCYYFLTSSTSGPRRHYGVIQTKMGLDPVLSKFTKCSHVETRSLCTSRRQSTQWCKFMVKKYESRAEGEGKHARQLRSHLFYHRCTQTQWRSTYWQQPLPTFHLSILPSLPSFLLFSLSNHLPFPSKAATTSWRELLILSFQQGKAHAGRRMHTKAKSQQVSQKIHKRFMNFMMDAWR